MKRFFSVLLIATILIADYTEAEAVAIPASATAAATAILAVGGVYYYMQSGGTTSVSGDYFTRSAAVSYAVINATTRAPEVITKFLTAKQPVADVFNAAKNSPSSYPLLSAATAVPANISQPSSLPANHIYRGSDGTYYKVNSNPVANLGWQSYGPVSAGDGYNFSYICSSSGGSCNASKAWLMHWYSVPNGNTNPGYASYNVYWQGISLASSAEIATVPVVAATTAQFRATIAPNGAVAPTYQAELDKMMQNPAYVPTFTDESGLPWAPPAAVLTPSQVSAAEKAVSALAATQTAVAAAAQASNSARSAANAAVAAAAANPSDPDAQRRAAYYVSIADQRDADLARTQADSAVLDAAQARESSDSEVPSVDAVARKTLNWERWKNLKNSMSNVWPFTLLTSLSGLLAQFVGPPVAPTFDLPIYGTTKVHIDLAIFDPIAAITRWAIGVLMSIGVVQILVNWYRGVSS